MNQRIDDPVRRFITVPMAIDLAFAAFTTGMMQWWESAEAPGERVQSGEILVWDSPYHVILTMQASELEIRFAVIDENTTRVELITRRCDDNAMHNPRTVLKSSQQVQNGGVMAKKHEEKTLDERQMMFLKTLAHGLRTGSISYDAYAKVRRLAVGDGDEEYYTVWNGVGRASQKILNEMTLEDLQFFVEQGRLTNFNDQQYQVNSHLILSAVPEG